MYMSMLPLLVNVCYWCEANSFSRLKASETEEKNKGKELEDTQVEKMYHLHVVILSQYIVDLN